MVLTGLEEKIRKTILTDLEDLDIIRINNYALFNKDTIAYAYSKNIIDDEAIEEVLESAAITQALKDYQILTDKKHKNLWGITHPDHAQRTDCFAYAIEQGVFSEKELSKIYFNHGETPEIYVKTYGKENIGESLRKELLNPKPFPKFNEEDYDPHPVCSCGH